MLSYRLQNSHAIVDQKDGSGYQDQEWNLPDANGWLVEHRDAARSGRVCSVHDGRQEQTVSQSSYTYSAGGSVIRQFDGALNT